MDPTDDKANFRGNIPTESSRPIRLGGSVLGPQFHICAFFHSHEEEYRVLLPFIQEGFARGEKVFHIVDPARRDDHLRRLASAGIDVTAIRQRGQFELRTWTDTHLCNGRFDQEKTLALFQEVVRDAKQQGFPLIRFVTHMEWALENRPGVDDLLEYEARANYIWLRQDGPVNPVICTYDLHQVWRGPRCRRHADSSDDHYRRDPPEKFLFRSAGRVFKGAARTARIRLSRILGRRL